MTDKSQNAAPGRESLGFVEAVRERFAFLTEPGFREVETLPTYVRYKRGSVEAAVFHGRSSYEIGFEAGAGARYGLGEIMRFTDPAAGLAYRKRSATTPQTVRDALDELAALVQRHAGPVLSGDDAVLARLAEQRRQWGEDFALDVLAEQTRPQADAAFRDKRYAEAAKLFERIEKRLTPAEQQKLDYARKHRT